MKTVVLGLGSNVGDRLDNLQRAVSALGRSCTMIAVSSVYQTPPWGELNQASFLNMCLAMKTRQTPLALLTYLKYLERSLGRVATYRWGPRLIDIDILFYDDDILRDDKLTIPHPGIPERPFVLAPLADIAPELVHPLTGQSVRQMLEKSDTVDVTLFSELFTEPVLEK